LRLFLLVGKNHTGVVALGVRRERAERHADRAMRTRLRLFLLVRRTSFVQAIRNAAAAREATNAIRTLR